MSEAEVTLKNQILVGCGRSNVRFFTDKTLIGNFLVTFSYFMSGKELLTKLKKRYEDSFDMIFLPSPKEGVETVPTAESNAKYAGALHERYAHHSSPKFHSS